MNWPEASDQLPAWGCMLSMPCRFPVLCSCNPAEVLADLEQPELGIEVPYLQYWANNGEFTQVCWHMG